jgi:hypothetical protein
MFEVRKAIGFGALALIMCCGFLITGAASSASAAGRNWTTLLVFHGAKHQACKVSVDDGEAWRVFTRLDGRNASTRVQAGLTVTKNGSETSRTWLSGWVSKGTVSSVGSVKLPRRAGWGLNAWTGGEQEGSGADFKADQVGRC